MLDNGPHLSPWDVLSPLDVFLPSDVLSLGTFCLRAFCMCIYPRTLYSTEEPVDFMSNYKDKFIQNCPEFLNVFSLFIRNQDKSDNKSCDTVSLSKHR